MRISLCWSTGGTARLGIVGDPPYLVCVDQGEPRMMVGLPDIYRKESGGAVVNL